MPSGLCWWSRAVASGGNRWQMRQQRKPGNQAKTVAVGCDQLPQKCHGKEGVALNRLSAKHAASPTSLSPGAALSTKARFRGPLVAQTSTGRLAQPCDAGLTGESKSPANEAVQRSSSPSVVVPDSACHAGGRGFESRRSRKVPANSQLLLPVLAQTTAGLFHPAHIPPETSPGIPAASRSSPVIPAT
jgi:hypothetical protein